MKKKGEFPIGQTLKMKKKDQLQYHPAYTSFFSSSSDEEPHCTDEKFPSKLPYEELNLGTLAVKVVYMNFIYFILV